jgi:hypothetical protein
MKLKEWLNKGEGGEWYEPYVTNKDLVFISAITIMVSAMLIGALWLLRF